MLQHHLIVLFSTLEETSLFILKIQIYMQKSMTDSLFIGYRNT